MLTKFQSYLHPYVEHTVLGIAYEGTAAVLTGLEFLVNRKALEILSKVVISIPLLILHHNLFAFGLAAGFVYSAKTREIVEKVNTVLKAQRTTFEQFTFYGLGGFLALLTMPTSMILATMYYSSQWGAFIFEESRKRYPSEAPASTDSDQFS